MSSADLIQAYKRIMANMLNLLADEQIQHLVTMVEKVPDDTKEIRSEFEKRSDVPRPQHWLTAVRLLKFNINLKNELVREYDGFLNTYQTLSQMQSRTSDQEKLLKETGDLLYQIDDLTGNSDRQVTKIFKELCATMVETHGMQLEPGEDFYKAKMTEKVITRLAADFTELNAPCREALKQISVMSALLRMRKLIMGEKATT